MYLHQLLPHPPGRLLQKSRQRQPSSGHPRPKQQLRCWQGRRQQQWQVPNSRQRRSHHLPLPTASMPRLRPCLCRLQPHRRRRNSLRSHCQQVQHPMAKRRRKRHHLWRRLSRLKQLQLSPWQEQPQCLAQNLISQLRSLPRQVAKQHSAPLRPAHRPHNLLSSRLPQLSRRRHTRTATLLRQQTPWRQSRPTQPRRRLHGREAAAAALMSS